MQCKNKQTKQDQTKTLGGGGGGGQSAKIVKMDIPKQLGGGGILMLNDEVVGG